MEHNVAYIATMLPSAMDMHRFIKQMRRDKVFESDTGYKVVTQIRSHKAKERLEYLLNYKLSATWLIKLKGKLNFITFFWQLWIPFSSPSRILWESDAKIGVYVGFVAQAWCLWPLLASPYRLSCSASDPSSISRILSLSFHLYKVSSGKHLQLQGSAHRAYW